MRPLLCILLLCFSAPSLLAKADPATRFADANKLYDQGNFRDAAAAYNDIIQDGYSSATLFFNLGNAWFKSGEIGRALAAYRQAEKFAPRDPDIRANMQFARNQVQGPSLKPSRIHRWFSRLTLNEWTLIAAAGLWLSLLLAAFLQWRPDLKRTLRTPLTASSFIAIILLACLATAYAGAKQNRAAVLITPNATVRLGPLDEAQTAFVLHDGAELLITDQKDDWLQITTDARRIGWLRQTNLIELSPSSQ